jgi:23S rRNA pseudouridine1911/1915/1917 synthase
VVGDKIYGPDSRLYLDFIDRGWSPRLEELLHLPRQALHCARIDLGPAGLPLAFSAPMPNDMRAFCDLHGLDASGAGALPGAVPGSSGADARDRGPQGGP